WTYSPDRDTPSVRSAGSRRTTGTPWPFRCTTTMSAVTSSSHMRISTVIVYGPLSVVEVGLGARRGCRGPHLPQQRVVASGDPSVDENVQLQSGVVRIRSGDRQLHRRTSRSEEHTSELQSR